MERKISIAIVGMGNLGKECLLQATQSADFNVVKIFTRQNIDELEMYKGRIDVLLVCVGSKHDAPILVPQVAKYFNTVDSFDTHDAMQLYISELKKICKKTVSIVGAGWDPGLFSVARIYFKAFLGNDVKTFYGPGVSLGHTNALKGVNGVKDAIQFTLPVKSENRHKRVCYIVPEKDIRACDLMQIEQEIKTMPHYFEPYETEVIFVKSIKKSLKHGGFVIGEDESSMAELKLRLKSNPRFTANVMLAYARAVVRLRDESRYGVYTVADIAPEYLIQNAIESI